MKILRRVVSVRLGDGHYLRLRRQSLRSGVAMSALLLVERWLDEQEERGRRGPSRRMATCPP